MLAEGLHYSPTNPQILRLAGRPDFHPPSLMLGPSCASHLPSFLVPGTITCNATLQTILTTYVEPAVIPFCLYAKLTTIGTACALCSCGFPRLSCCPMISHRPNGSVHEQHRASRMLCHNVRHPTKTRSHTPETRPELLM